MARKKLVLIAFFCVIFMVAGLFVGFKNTRILAPKLFGLACVSDRICIDDPRRSAQAIALADDAVTFVRDTIGPLADPPRFYFCTTRSCFATFGNPQVAALYFWGANVVLINEIGWQPHILRHEVIHHWQAETFGVFRAAHDLPRWYIEGMAYTMAQDPRPVIPNAQADQFRREFQSWMETQTDWRQPPG